MIFVATVPTGGCEKVFLAATFFRKTKQSFMTFHVIFQETAQNFMQFHVILCIYALLLQISKLANHEFLGVIFCLKNCDCRIYFDKYQVCQNVIHLICRYDRDKSSNVPRICLGQPCCEDRYYWLPCQSCWGCSFFISIVLFYVSDFPK